MVAALSQCRLEFGASAGNGLNDRPGFSAARAAGRARVDVAAQR